MFWVSLLHQSQQHQHILPDDVFHLGWPTASGSFQATGTLWVFLLPRSHRERHLSVFFWSSSVFEERLNIHTGPVGGASERNTITCLLEMKDHPSVVLSYLKTNSFKREAWRHLSSSSGWSLWSFFWDWYFSETFPHSFCCLSPVPL